MSEPSYSEGIGEKKLILKKCANRYKIQLFFCKGGTVRSGILCEKNFYIGTFLRKHTLGSVLMRIFWSCDMNLEKIMLIRFYIEDP